MLWMKVKTTVPVPLEMYHRLHESLLADGGGCLSRGISCEMPLFILGSLSQTNCKTWPEPIILSPLPYLIRSPRLVSTVTAVWGASW
jgi:hypothetical protein